MNILGQLAFIVGIVVAICGGIWGGESVPTNDWIIAILLITGVLIGLLNITAREAPTVLISTMALILLGIWGVSSAFTPVLGLSQGLGENLIGIVDCFAILMAPAAIIISMKAVFATASPD